MFKIGEFSRLTCLSIRMLRYYDEVGLLKPLRTDRYSGYRFYSAEQILAANRIRMLRDLGFGVEEIRQALALDNEALSALLARRRQAVEAEMGETLSRYDGAISQLSRMAAPPQVKILSVPSYSVLSLRGVIPDYYSEGRLWKTLSALAEERGIPLKGEAFSIYHDPDYREVDVDVELCAILPAEARFSDQYGEEVPGGKLTMRRTEAVAYMASSMVEGPFENIAGAFLAMAEYLESQAQYVMGETSRQWVHKGHWNAKNPQDYLTEIQIPLAIGP